MLHLCLLLLAAVATAPEAPPVRGRFCIGQQCTNTVGTTIAVTPDARERTFVWTSADEATLQLGVIPAKAGSVALAAEPTSTIELAIAGTASPNWPADVEARLEGKRQFRWKLNAKSVARLHKLVVPRGRYRLELKADHHRTLNRSQLDANGAVVKLGELRMLPLPFARGVVVDVEEHPIADATIQLDNGSICAMTNEQGAFACELTEGRLEALTVSRSSFGPKELALPAVRESDIDLGRIPLMTGRTLSLKVVRPEHAPVRVTLFYNSPKRYQHAKLKTIALAETEDEVRFDASAGTFLVVVEGDGPFERLEEKIEIEDAGVQKEIVVRPYQLVGTATFGETPLAGGKMSLIAPENSWRAVAPVKDGSFGGTLWQPGKLRAFLDAPETGVSDLLVSPELGEDPSHWDVRIENRQIFGRMYDAETKAPIVQAIDITGRFDDGAKYFSVKPEADGSYHVLASKAGVYSMRVARAEYVSFEKEVHVAPDSKSQTVDIALERGVLQPLEIVDSSGAPIPNALIIEGVQPDGINPRFMVNADAGGMYSLRGHAGETRLFYVVPRSGSFAVVRLQMPASSEGVKPRQVIVPAPSASLRVHAVDDSGAPAARSLFIRYNGEFVPRAIARFVNDDTFSTDKQGDAVLGRLPAGMYEVWALGGGRGEEQELMMGATRAPVRVGLSSGEASIEIVAPPLPPRK